MKYVYGTSFHGGRLRENLKIVGEEPTNLAGYICTVRKFKDGTKITDRCRIVEKYASKESNGVFYDWYVIDNHYRETDISEKSKAMADKINANLDYISMMSGIDIPDESEIMTLESDEHSKNFKKVSDYAKESLWNAGMIANAVGKWITEEEYAEIIGST